MVDWEYKEYTWFEKPVMPKLKHYRKTRESPDQKMYASLDPEYSSSGFHLGKDGYPEFTLLELDGLKEESFSLGGTILPNRQFAVPLEEAERQIAEWTSKLIPDFTSWLGHHSKEGWEIFKISRIKNSQYHKTWCIFRRKI